MNERNGELNRMAQERSRYDEILASNAEDQAAYAQLRTLERPSGKPSRQNALFANPITAIMRFMKLFSVLVAVLLFAVLWMTLYPDGAQALLHHLAPLGTHKTLLMM